MISRNWLTFAAILALLTGSAADAAPMRVRGTRVDMEKPAGFVDAPNFSGFQHAEDGSSIMVTEMPAPYAQATAGFNAEGLASRGMKLVSKLDTKVGHFPAMLLEVTQNAYGTDYRKWMLVFGDPSRTVIVAGTAANAVPTASDVVKKAVLSTSYAESAAVPSMVADLPFTISGTKDLKLANRIQNMLLFTTDGKIGQPKPKDPTLFIVGQALATNMDIPDKTAFARKRLQQTEGVSNLEVLSEGDVKISGLPAREIAASAVGKKGDKVFILQIIVYAQHSYFVMQGLTDLSMRAAREPEFRLLANSFKLK